MIQIADGIVDLLLILDEVISVVDDEVDDEVEAVGKKSDYFHNNIVFFQKMSILKSM